MKNREKTASVIFDADVLIWALRGNMSADRVIASAEMRFMSVVNYMEVLRGVRDKNELRQFRAFISRVGIDLLPLTENISFRAVSYMETHALSVMMSAPDALVAATAVEHQMPLCTANDKHFRVLREVEIRKFRP